MGIEITKQMFRAGNWAITRTDTETNACLYAEVIRRDGRWDMVVGTEPAPSHPITTPQNSLKDCVLWMQTCEDGFVRSAIKEGRPL